MHELGIVFHIIKKVEEVAAENSVSAVNSVTLEIGEVSTIVDTYLQDCWKWAAAKSDYVKGAELLIETRRYHVQWLRTNLRNGQVRQNLPLLQQ